MRNFELETYFSKWGFTARHHMTASDVQTLLAMASDEDKAKLDDLWLGYTETWGAPDLRSQISQTYDNIPAKNILCMAGAGKGIYASMRALLKKSDHVIVIVPNYQSAESVPLDICQVSGVTIRHENNWHLDIDDIKQAIRSNTKIISINFPHNPTGAVIPIDDLDTLVALCRQKGIYLFNDEVYRGVEIDTNDQMP